ncbi:MAG: glycosyltransferase family 39 protein, partial [Gemmataceae bacterium]
MNRIRRFDLVWLLACGLVSSAWCLTASPQLSATYDEPYYLRAGLDRWRTGDFTGLKGSGVMPLPVDVCTLPVYVLERWRGSPIDIDLEIESVLPVARAANLLFWWALLGYAFRIGRDLAGPWAGRLAALLLACEPNCLAHATLATTDIAFTATLLMLAHAYRANRAQRWPRRVILPAVCYAAAVLAKASAIVFCPLCLFVLEVEYQWSTGDRGVFRRSLRSGLHLLTVAALGFLLASVYCGPDHGSAHTKLVRVAHALPLATGRDALASVPIYSQAWDAIKFQIIHNMTGHGGVF